MLVEVFGNIASFVAFSDQPENPPKKGKRKSKASAANQLEATPTEPLTEVPSTSEDYNGL